MRLTPRSTIVLAPILALGLLQVWIFGSGLGRVHLENALIGTVILKSNIPIHGSPAFPWIIFPYFLLCIGMWEVLETTRRPDRVASWQVIFSDQGCLAKLLGRHFAGIGLAAAIMIVFNYLVTTSLPLIYVISK